MAKYFHIDDILIEEEFVPVLFHKTANGVTIDPSSESNCVEQGAKVEVPFWLAHELHLRQAVSINLPACFDQKTRLEVQADAACVDLRSRCPYFYEFGWKLESLVTDRTLGILLSTAFKIRYKEALTKVYTAAHITASKYLSFLTIEETNLYEAAHLSMTAFKKWRTGEPRLQRVSENFLFSFLSNRVTVSYKILIDTQLNSIMCSSVDSKSDPKGVLSFTCTNNNAIGSCFSQN